MTRRQVCSLSLSFGDTAKGNISFTYSFRIFECQTLLMIPLPLPWPGLSLFCFIRTPWLVRVIVSKMFLVSRILFPFFQFEILSVRTAARAPSPVPNEAPAHLAPLSTLPPSLKPHLPLPMFRSVVVACHAIPHYWVGSVTSPPGLQVP